MNTLRSQINDLEAIRLDLLKQYTPEALALIDLCQRIGASPQSPMEQVRHSTLRRLTLKGISLMADDKEKEFNPDLNAFNRYRFLAIEVSGSLVAQVLFLNDALKVNPTDKFIPGEWLNQLKPAIDEMKAEIEAAENAALEKRLRELQTIMLVGKKV